MIGILYKIRHLLPVRALKQIYYGLIHSHLCYMSSSWGNAGVTTIKRIQVLQNRALKMIYNLPILTPTYNLYNEHVKDILPVRGISFYSNCKFVASVLHGRIHSCTQFSRITSRGALRDPNRLNVAAARSFWGGRHIRHRGPSLFNQLPHDLRALTHKLSFDKQLKKCLLSSEWIRRFIA